MCNRALQAVELQGQPCRGHPLNAPGEGHCTRKQAGQTRTADRLIHVCITEAHNNDVVADGEAAVLSVSDLSAA